MNSTTVIAYFLVILLWTTSTLSLPFTGSCDSCGKECQSACGTRGFRTCCLNYLKKRNGPSSTDTKSLTDFASVLSELAQYYPSLRNLISEMTDENQMAKIFFEKPNIDKIKFSELE